MGRAVQSLAQYLHRRGEYVRVPRDTIRELFALLRHYPIQEAVGSAMTPAEAKNLMAMKGKLVYIEWRRQEDDWPYFLLLDVDAKAGTIKLRGMDCPQELGRYKHDGDEFHADWNEIKKIKPVNA